MKKCFSRYWLALFALSVMSSAVFADQVWRGTCAPSVLDEDVVIKGDVLLQLGSTKIEAIHRDVTVKMTKDAKLSGHWAGESQLYLMAAEGRTIHFEVDHDMKFIGSSSITGDDLLIVQSGPGDVSIAIQPGKSFKITSEDCSGGVQMYVLMYGGPSAPCDEYCADEYCCDEYCDDEYCALGNGQNETRAARPRLSFVNIPNVSRRSDIDTKVVIGKKSRLSFLSSRPVGQAEDAGFITFDPASNTLGRMVLKIKDTGSFVAAGHFTSQRNGSCITLANIDLSTPAGHDAVWSITNSRGPSFPSGLLVLDENETMFDLLADPFLSLETRAQGSHSRGNFSGHRFGVVIGANGTLLVQSNSYLDFVGLALNQVPSVDTTACYRSDLQPSKELKMRNPSALFIDGNRNPNSTPARIVFEQQAAAFFRSGIANDGVIRHLGDVDPFTIDALEHTPGFGAIVFDVEGELNVEGTLNSSGEVTSKIELLSLEVVSTGGSLFVGSSEINFPSRTFNTEDCELLAYNTGAFLINNNINLRNTALSHTDINHHVFPNDDVRSEPTYIGGETFKLLDSPERPSIRFFNSNLLVNADIALTGVDLVVPNLVDENGIMHKNNSNFIFYSSGSCVDNGTGRDMVLGTRIGSTAADGCTRIDNDAHLDVIQLFNSIGIDYPIADTDNQTLHLLSGINSAAITGVQPQSTASINTIYLGNTSNVSIGTNADTTGFNIDTNPWLRIQGNYFSFSSRGGMNRCPSTSNVTGQGGIFVDLNGKLSIDPGYLASFCVMITKTQNGIVDLPAGQVFFCEGLGITSGNTDLSDPQVLVASGDEVSDLVFNWHILGKDCAHFSPYQPGSPCCPAVTQDNVSSLPIIQGTVDNLIIQGSRLGDPATFIIDGGIVRNIEFSSSSCCNSVCDDLSGQAPVATIILRNNGVVEFTGEGAGAVGITVIADGSGRVDLLGDVTIASQCAFVKGPNFAAGDVLTISADIAREIILPAFGTLDLRTFNAETDVVEFTGSAQLAVEPGSSIITGAGILRFTDNAQIRFEAAANAAAFFEAIAHGAHNPLLTPLATIDAAQIHNQYDFLTNFGAGLHNTDPFRIRLMGEGVIELSGNARAFLPLNSFVGVETTPAGAPCEVAVTDLELRLLDNAQFIVGELNLTQGGVFQVGNVEDQNATGNAAAQLDHSVNFTLTINGDNADFFIGSQGFVGLGVGIERFDGRDELGQVVPNENIVNTLFNVDSITFNFLQGRFEHDRIFSGDDPRASLFAINGDESIFYNMILDSTAAISEFNLAGGGNMILTFPGVGGLHPIVLDQDGQVEVAPGVFDPRLYTSLIASSALQDNTLQALNLTGLELFDLLKTHDAVLEPTRPNTFGRANAATLGETFRPQITSIRIGLVSQDEILRGDAFTILGRSGVQAENRQVADEVGAVFVNIDQELNEVLTVSLIQ